MAYIHTCIYIIIITNEFLKLIDRVEKKNQI